MPERLGHGTRGAKVSAIQINLDGDASLRSFAEAYVDSATSSDDL